MIIMDIFSPRISARLSCLVLLVLTSCIQQGAERDSLASIEFDPESIRGVPGYFRVGRSTEGQWWFLDPDDQPFFYKGVCAVNRAGTAGGRRAKDGPYAAVVDARYGYQADPDSFVEAQIKRLRDWGFNAFGAWTTEEFFDRGMPYTEIVEFFKEGPLLELPGDARPLPDIFDPAWLQAVNSKARTLCASRRYSRDLVGYFTDNEIGFGRSDDTGLDLGFGNSDRFGYSLLRSFLGLEAGVPARERAWAFVWERYDSFDALSRAWGIPIRSAQDLHQFNAAQKPIDTGAYLADARAFQLFYAAHYFRTTYETIKRYDPNHLVLGCRFGAPPDTALLRVMKPWVDVISQNNYRPNLYQRVDYLHRNTGLPVLIGEFSWNPDLFKQVPLPGEPEGGLGAKERVFRRGEEVLLRAATHPGMVGYTWYRWVAKPTEDDNLSFGLVDQEDRPEIHIPRLQALHPRIEPLRATWAGMADSARNANSGTVAISLRGMRPGWDHLLNLEVREGQFLPEAFGWQMEGRNVAGTLSGAGGSIRLEVDFQAWYWQGKQALEAGLGAYEVRLQRDGQYLSGAYEGTYNGERVHGEVEGYFLPMIPPAFPIHESAAMSSD